MVSIVDADMVLRSDFYQRTLPYLQTERDAMVLAPQVRPRGRATPRVLRAWLRRARRHTGSRAGDVPLCKGAPSRLSDDEHDPRPQQRLKRSLCKLLSRRMHACAHACARGWVAPAARERADPPPTRAQEFHNYNPATDIFCHSNRLFWDVTCPGIVDGFGGVMCTGTNYVVRSRALLKARPARML